MRRERARGLLRAIRLVVAHGSTVKAMSMLGEAALGPPCADCGKRRTSFMLPSHVAVAEQLLQKPRSQWAGACQCPLERDALRRQETLAS